MNYYSEKDLSKDLRYTSKNLVVEAFNVEHTIQCLGFDPYSSALVLHQSDTEDFEERYKRFIEVKRIFGEQVFYLMVGGVRIERNGLLVLHFGNRGRLRSNAILYGLQ